MLNVKNRCWSKEMMKICDVREEQLPALFESYEVVGGIKTELAEEFGFTINVKIVAGQTITQRLLWEQEPLVKVAVIFLWVLQVQSLFPVKISG